MNLFEAVDEAFACELEGGQIILANGTSGRGPNLVRGTVLEVVIKGDDWISVKYTCDEYGNGDPSAPDTVDWHESNGVFTWSTLRAKHWIEDDGTAYFGVPTDRESTARITPIAILATAAA